MDAHKPDQPTVADDPQAREVLRRAFENTARWPKDFKGFTADLTVNLNGRELHGPVIVKGPPGSVRPTGRRGHSKVGAGPTRDDCRPSRSKEF